jgi:oligopeptidase A
MDNRMSATLDQNSPNPLLTIDFRVPFDHIAPSHVEPAVAALLAQARAAVEVLAAEAGPRTYANTLEALENATEELETVMTVVGHLESVRSDPELRAAYNKTRPEVSAFFASIPMHEGLWRAIKAFENTSEFGKLEGARRRFAKKTIDDFRRHGAELDPAGKKRLEAITRELAELTNRFAQNLLDETSAWSLLIDDQARLAGLPPSALEQARQSAESKGQAGFRFTLQAPSVIAALTYLDDAALREQIYRAYNRRASEGERDNRPVIDQILALRREEATLLGFRDFADFVLHDRMAKTGDQAQAFVEDLERRTRPAFGREQSALLEFRRSIEGQDAPELSAWDIGYYGEKQRKALFDFDEEILRPYFSATAVLDGLFQTAHRLYGIDIRGADDMPRWHPDVRCFEVFDKAELLGAFYADLFPREEKRGGAWMNAFITGGPDGSSFRPHLGLICANVTPPVGDKPALLTHDEVATLFHEFGHLLHHLLSRVEVRSLGGTNVAWDFVELPSQIMENWCWEREALDLFARHYQTQATIPDELFQKITRARTYREGSAMMRQLGFASIDLAIHRNYQPDRDGPIVDYVNRILGRYSPSPLPDGYAFITSFGHLFSSAVGYAAGYYSYKWAEVLDADAFNRFREAGVFDRKVGDAFRRSVLERGDSEDPMALFVAFMGREPDPEALLLRSGLTPA